jgi:glycosyltransferase involved in cell wall biosynthesis
MIVGIDATTLKGRLSGVGYYTARLIDSLANGAGEGVLDDIVVLSNQAVPLPPLRRLRVHEGGRFRVRSIWMQFMLPAILRELRPDIVHFTNYLAPATCETPYVLSIHDMSLQLFPECHTWRKRLLSARLLPLAARGARLILTPSESTRRDVVRLLGTDPARVRVIPYAASPRFAAVAPDYASLERRFGVRPPYFLYVGTLEPRKNLERTLRAFARVARALPEHSFVLVGQRGWKYAATLREAARPELQGRVVLAGYVPEQDLPELMSGAVAFVYPSLYEGFGLPVVEAMACGTPVLTSRSSSLAEIADGAALLVEPKDESALADALVALATDPALRAGLVERGARRSADYSWDRTGRETVAAYQEVLRPRTISRLPRPTGDPDEAILRTVTYASLFEAPLSLDALDRSLMDVALDRRQLEQRLAAQPLAARLAVTDGLVHPRGREGWLEERRERESHTGRLLARHRRALRTLQVFPYVRLVALSGACAHQNATDDDVDVFLVAREGRAWGVFLALMLWAKAFGLRRSLCLNYIVDEAALALPERDLFTAAELVGMRPLAGRETYRRVIRSNTWLGERFPNFARSFEARSAEVPERAGARRLEALLDLGPAPLFEAFSRRVLGAYLRWRTRGSSGVRLDPHRLKLHTDDHGPRLVAAFEAALGRASGGAEQPGS